MPHSHLLRASMATFAEEGNMRAGATYHVSRFTVIFLDWLLGVCCVWLFVVFWGGCWFLFGCVLSCQSSNRTTKSIMTLLGVARLPLSSR